MSSRECEEVHRRAKKNAPRGRVYMILVAPPRDSQVMENKTDIVQHKSAPTENFTEKNIFHTPIRIALPEFGASHRERVGAKNRRNSSTTSESLAGASVSLDRFTNALHCICFAGSLPKADDSRIGSRSSSIPRFANVRLIASTRTSTAQLRLTGQQPKVEVVLHLGVQN